MNREQIQEALNEISDAQIAEASEPQIKNALIPFLKHRLRSPRTWAAVVAVVLVIGLLANPMILSASAVATADYPDYEWVYRGWMNETASSLSSFFADSMKATLSGAGNENQTYSPINLYMALCLTAELTGGNEQILDALGTESLENLRTQANDVWNACYLDKNNQTLLANSLWLDKSLQYNQSVMDTLADSYYTSVYQADLGSSAANRAIASWLNGQTGNMLKQDTAKVDLDPNTVLALYSTVYYQAKWNTEFQSSNNTKDVFHAPGGDITVTYMNAKNRQANYYWGEDFGAVALGLKDGSSMWLFLPDEGKTVDDILISGEYMQMVTHTDLIEGENYKYMKVNLTIPKFDIRSSGDLKGDLQAIGITDIFEEENSALSYSVTSDLPVWVDGVNQATRVAIDEKGVTAASYIEIPGAGAAMPPEEIIDFILDRPFLFVITNRYNLPLFAGVVNDP